MFERVQVELHAYTANILNISHRTQHQPPDYQLSGQPTKSGPGTILGSPRPGALHRFGNASWITFAALLLLDFMLG